MPDGTCPHGVYVQRSTDCPDCWDAEHPGLTLRPLPGGGVGYEVPGLEDTFERVDPAFLGYGPDPSDPPSDRHTGWAEDPSPDSDPYEGDR